jgi:hypothetical protein
MVSMLGIAVAWESITFTITQNRFSKCGFGIEDAVDIEDDQNNSKWVALQVCIDFPSNFNVFLNVDWFIPTTEDQSYGNKIGHPLQ